MFQIEKLGYVTVRKWLSFLSAGVTRLLTQQWTNAPYLNISPSVVGMNNGPLSGVPRNPRFTQQSAIVSLTMCLSILTSAYSMEPNTVPAYIKYKQWLPLVVIIE